jgi:hypothetical protein
MENIEKALKVVTNKENQFRIWMQEPFNIGKNVYSTDAHSIMKVPNNSVRVFDECAKPENAKLILDYFDFKKSDIMDIKVSELKDAISKIPLVDECMNADTEGKCTECEGKGEVEWEYESYTKDMDCPACDGEGVITETKKEKTGRKIKAEGYFIDINISRLRTVMIEQLIAIADLLNVEIIKVVNQTKPNRGVYFKVGIAEIVMMPVLLTDEQNIIQRFESLSEKKALAKN